MSGYRRFIAYVYEYRKGKKERNCGFIKVEVRDERCTMEVHLHPAGLTPDIECRVYCFVRKDGLMNGILLGTCETGEDTVECLIDAEALDMGGSGVSMGRMGGMILTTETGGFFGTEWDDQPIRPDNFREMRAEKTEKEAEEQEETKEKIKEEIKEESKEQEEEPVEREEVLEEKTEIPEEQEEEPLEKMEEAKEEKKEEEAVSEPVEGKEESRGEMVKTTSLSEDETVKTTSLEENDTPPIPEPQPYCPIGEAFRPFEDNDLVQCWKIHPQDFSCFPRRQCALRNNRFLQYGYSNFGHILLCRRADGQYILGVPGSYDQQERFMAGMFGFPYFRESPAIEIPNGRGGYWYRLIDAPDFHKRNTP